MAWRSVKKRSWQPVAQVMLCVLLSVHGGALYLASASAPVRSVMPMKAVAGDRTISPTPSPSPSPSPAATTTAPRVLGSSTGGSAMSFGIASGGLAAYSAPQLDAAMSGMTALGVHWVRFDLDWSNVQADGPASYNWGDYDRLVQTAGAHGLKVLAILDFTPGWARRADCSGSKMCVPADPAAYANFAAAAVQHYQGQGVHAWEVWNEENTASFFQPAADPVAYTGLLRAAYGAIKRADGGAVVLSGGLAPAASGGGNLAPPDFASGMYNAGAQGSFDAFGDHPYTYPNAPGVAGAWIQMQQLHSIMSAHGDDFKKIWITEFGAPTGGSDPAYRVDEAGQAQELAAAVRLAAGYSWVGGFFCYTYLDPGSTQDTNENFFGLVRADGSHKPAFAAYQQAIAGR